MKYQVTEVTGWWQRCDRRLGQHVESVVHDRNIGAAAWQVRSPQRRVQCIPRERVLIVSTIGDRRPVFKWGHAASIYLWTGRQRPDTRVWCCAGQHKLEPNCSILWRGLKIALGLLGEGSLAHFDNPKHTLSWAATLSTLFSPGWVQNLWEIERFQVHCLCSCILSGTWWSKLWFSCYSWLLSELGVDSQSW